MLIQEKSSITIGDGPADFANKHAQEGSREFKEVAGNIIDFKKINNSN